MLRHFRILYFQPVVMPERVTQVEAAVLHLYVRALLKGAFPVGPVSYTHLDVYKRQALHTGAESINHAGNAVENAADYGNNPHQLCRERRVIARQSLLRFGAAAGNARAAEVEEKDVYKRQYMTYVLADSSKFGKAAAVTICPMNKVCIITSRLPDEAYRQHAVIKEVEAGSKSEKTSRPAKPNL